MTQQSGAESSASRPRSDTAAPRELSRIQSLRRRARATPRGDCREFEFVIGSPTCLVGQGSSGPTIDLFDGIIRQEPGCREIFESDRRASPSNQYFR